MRSAETTGPFVVSEACSAMGPRADSSAATISAPFPSVGSWVLPVALDADGAGEAPADAPAEPAGVALPEAAGLADGAGDTLALGAGLADVDGWAATRREETASGVR